MKILVTGATGFIGRHFVSRLAKDDCEIVCAGRSLDKLSCFRGRTKNVYFDIEDAVSVGKIISDEKPDVIVHCAALVENKSLSRLMKVNAEGTRNVLNACLRENVEKVIYLSSIAVISGNLGVCLKEDMPYCATNRYGESKIEAEKIALDYRDKGLKLSILRPCMVYGTGEPHLLPLLVDLIRWRLLPVLGRGDNKLHFVGVDNVVDVMMLALKKEAAFKGTYILADKEVLSMYEVFSYIAKVVGARPPFRISKPLVFILTHLPFIGWNFSLMQKNREYSIERMVKDLDYAPRVSIYDGLKKAVLSFRTKDANIGMTQSAAIR